MYILSVEKQFKFTHSRRKRQYNYKCIIKFDNETWSWWQHQKPNKKDAVKFLAEQDRIALEEEIEWAYNNS